MTDTTDDIAEDISFQSFEDDCKLLGSLLMDVLHREVGPQFMESVERKRTLAQSAVHLRQAGMESIAELLEKQLSTEISQMTLEEAVALARAFSHYLNLMGIAETHHSVRRAHSVTHLSKSCDDIFSKLIQSGVPPEELYNTVCNQEVEIVLTAHPTQINRRTLQYKHIRITHLLEFNERPDLSHEDREMLIEDLVREITSLWQTDELRRHKPTPVDEARAGLQIVEQSLWKAVPHYLRRVSAALKKHTGRPLPLTCTPVKFGSWMGGDRDGNPSVTSKVTRDVSLLSRWMAIDLYIREVDNLRFELSTNRCSDKLASLAQEILLEEGASQDQQLESWDQLEDRSPAKPYGLQTSALPAQLPLAAELPSCRDGDSQYPILDFPDDTNCQKNGQSLSFQSCLVPGRDSPKKIDNGAVTAAENAPPSPRNQSPTGLPKKNAFSSNQLIAQRKLYAESQTGRSSFQKLLEPTLHHRPGITPYTIVFGHIKDKLMKTQKRLELLLEDLPCEHDPINDYETSDQLLEPLLLCYESLQSSGSGVLADGRLVDLIRRVATFGMVLMKLDLRQEPGRHAETLDAITKYLDMGVYSEWDEDKKLEFLTRELKGKRPLVPPAIEVASDVKEVLDTFHVAAELGSDCLGAYVISMASNASDVLAVELLQKDARLYVSGELGRPCPGGT